MARHVRPGSARGQTLVEFALVLPLFLTLVVGILVLGIGLFYQQQVVNAAREAARYAAIHSATAECPTSSWLPFNPGMVPSGAVVDPLDQNCDPAATQWPLMQAHGRDRAGFGFVKSDLHFAACWTGYTELATGAYDAPPFAGDGSANQPPEPCTINGTDPVTNTSALPCPPDPTVPTDDKASNLAVSSGGTANQVTVYGCYLWRPPMAGFLLIPETVTLRATITEIMQHQR